MTTHDQHTDVYGSEGHVPAHEDETRLVSKDEAYATEGQHLVPEDQVAPRESDVAGSRGAGQPSAPMDSQHTGAQREDPTEGRLFADDELAGLRARWDSVQAAFVDDPKDCVQKADRLVADLLDQLTTGFTQARSRLEEQWTRGEQASTEDLRVALKRYRSFFERLLSV